MVPTLCSLLQAGPSKQQRLFDQHRKRRLRGGGVRWCSSALCKAGSAGARPPSRRRRMIAACRASGAGPPRGASPPAFISVVVDRVPLEHFLLDVCGHVSELCWFVGRKDIESALFEQSNTIFQNISLAPRVARAANCRTRHIFHSLSARAAAAGRSTTMMMRSTEVAAAAQHPRSGRVAARRERRKTAAAAVPRAAHSLRRSDIFLAPTHGCRSNSSRGALER